MSDQTATAHVPPDDPDRQLTVVDPDDRGLQHVGVVSDTYTVLITAEQTAGRYAMLDMLIPPGGGPPPHRHDFEEQFHLLDGEIELTFRGEKVTVRAGQTVNVPARAPHQFTNAADRTARMLCIVSPPGLEQYFADFGEKLPSRTSKAPMLGEEELATRIADAAPLAARFHIENLPPDTEEET